MFGEGGDDEATESGARVRMGSRMTGYTLGILAETLLPVSPLSRVAKDNRRLGNGRVETMAMRFLLVRPFTSERLVDDVCVRFAVASTENDSLVEGEFTGKSGNR